MASYSDLDPEYESVMNESHELIKSGKVDVDKRKSIRMDASDLESKWDEMQELILAVNAK